MPEFVTLYSYTPTPGVIRTVIRSTLDPTYINYNDFATGIVQPQPPDGVIVSVICQPGTFDRYTYKVSTLSPFATFTKEINSPFCGYVPPSCDIAEVSFAVTDETSAGADNGTVNLFCTSSFMPITYFMSPPLPDPPQTNTTGYFTGLKPGTSYYINATDANACSIHHDFVILPFSDDYTHFKYRLQFKSAGGEIDWELQLYDMRNAYLKTDYPKDVEGNEDPVIRTIQDQDENKFTPIVVTQLEINLNFDGTLFTLEEFSQAPQQTWYVQLVSGTDIYFKGYLIPDEMQDYYADPPYIVALLATDGLPNLKGNKWGNGSGGQGFGALQIQQYGLTTWAALLKQCLDQLGYNYGDVHIISSLQYNNAFSTGLWLNISTWSDILYDSEGVPVSTYDALALLLTGLKLCMVQEMGEFRLINWNDLFYINNGVLATAFRLCFYRIISNFTAIVNEDVNIEYQIIGFDAPFRPVKPPQTLNYDKPYNVENDVSFNLLALLFENPSFEIGAVQGDLPPEFEKNGTITAYCNYDPLTDVIGSGAYDGNWEVKIFATGVITPNNTYINNKGTTNSNTFPIDQSNKLVNVSFAWKVPQSFFTVDSNPTGYVFSFAIVYTDGTTGNKYFIKVVDTKSISYQDYLINHPTHNPPNQPSQTIWEHLADTYYTEGDACGIKGIPTTDYIGWQNFSLTSAPLPETQMGTIEVRFYGCKAQLYDSSLYLLVPLDNPVFKQSLYIDLPDTDPGYYLIDALNITLSDASSIYSNQTGEKHITTVVTGLPPADVLQNDLSLFTYPNNKRVAGNIFYGTDYLTAVVANTWGFGLRSTDKLDRIPAIITKAYARQYQRQMYKYEGGVLAPYMTYFAVYGLRFYEGRLFMCYKLESHFRTNVHNITLIEISDVSAQNVYSYVPQYQRNARNQ